MELPETPKIRRNINELCLRKISRQVVRTKLSEGSTFSNMLYGKKRRPGNARNRQKVFQMKKHLLLTVTITRKLLKSYQFVI